MSNLLSALILTFSSVLSFCLGFLLQLLFSRKNVTEAEIRARQIINNAEEQAKIIVSQGALDSANELHRLRTQFDESVKNRRQEVMKEEQWLAQRKENLDRQMGSIEAKERQIATDHEAVQTERHVLEHERTKIATLMHSEEEALQKIAGLSRDEARQSLMAKLERDVEYDSANLIRRKQQEALEQADKLARDIITQAIQRCASEHVAETTVSSVMLPNDDMKGRIIGREGRNIRALEQETGVEILIDDTPNAVVISGFDPVRRECARRTLERLIADGRIHPARIEEILQKVRKELSDEIEEAGAKAAMDLGIVGIHPELLKLIGRLKFRTSYGQNLLRHSVEVAKIMASLSAELREDTTKAKRVGLLHDIGKAVDHEVEGAHAAIGADLAKRHGEAKDIVNAIAAHHNEAEPESRLAVLASAADAISAARPGARSESYDLYLRRIDQLEKIAAEEPGVQSAFAIQAGRELRVLVDAEGLDDSQSIAVARKVAKRVSDEVQFPGQIKVTVVREKRFIEYAR